ncbi:ROK family protein [Paenarthrobacter sp. NPDC089322]|uniref:ROK family protein n=1 Tax=Paenarthrobacter sp. NPDC089322 TaxID=3155065 RepID=UPI003424F598
MKCATAGGKAMVVWLAEPTAVPVLEIGGTHVTAALVRRPAHGPVTRCWHVLAGSVVRNSLDAQGSADNLLAAFASAANALGNEHTGRWGIALPGPFDYRRGVGQYQHVGKFENLRGIDVRAELTARLDHTPMAMVFLNDAHAFGIGAGAHSRTPSRSAMAGRTVCITLGTGIGSSFLEGGLPVTAGPGVPPDGHCHRIGFQGRPLEETASRRAIRRAYAASSGLIARHADDRQAAECRDMPDVHNIARLARGGDSVATAVWEHAFVSLGAAIGPYINEFGAQELLVGGSMTASWDILEPALRQGLTLAEAGLRQLPVVRFDGSEEASLVGAAIWAARTP